MKMDACALVITSSVYISAPLTALKDPEERASQYIDAITFFIMQTSFGKIIVCDNSAYNYPSSLKELAVKQGKELELLSFAGDKASVEKYGKGYGEGEIMAFVMQHSKLVKTVTGFLKITGRLKITNVAAVMRKCNPLQNYFMPVSLLRPRWMVPKAARPCVEVRTYYTTVDFFTAYLLNAYKQVNDHNIYFLEHAYHDAIAASKQTVKCFLVAPEITGMSGSNGWIFKERSLAKRMLIRVVYFLGYIKPIYKGKV